MIDDTRILLAIDAHAGELVIPAGALIEPKPLIAAFVGNESSWGAEQFVPRREAAWCRGGKYYWAQANDWVRKLVTKYGDAAGSSWGCVQMMYPVAIELGLQGHPWRIADDPDLAIALLVAYLNKRAFVEWHGAPKIHLVRPAMSVEEAGDAYNTGSFRDDNHNPKYEHDLRANYLLALDFYHGAAA